MARAQSPLFGWGVRKSSVLIAVAAVLIALLGGGALLVLALQSALTSTTTDSVTSRAGEIVSLATESGIDDAGLSGAVRLRKLDAGDNSKITTAKPFWFTLEKLYDAGDYRRFAERLRLQ